MNNRAFIQAKAELEKELLDNKIKSVYHTFKMYIAKGMLDSDKLELDNYDLPLSYGNQTSQKAFENFKDVLPAVFQMLVDDFKQDYTLVYGIYEDRFEFNLNLNEDVTFR